MAKGDKSVQVSAYNHHQAKHAADRRGISIKAWVAEAIAEKLGKEK